MHELSFFEGIIKTLEEQKKIHHIIRVNKVTIMRDKFNCLCEENLQFSFDD